MKKISYILSLVLLLVMMHSCDLPLRTTDDYNGKSLDINQYKTCWEFIESREDLTNMKVLVELCGLKEYYAQTETKYTFLLWSNKALTDTELEEAKQDATKLASLKDALLFHIIKGYYHAYGPLTYEITFVETLSNDPDIYMSLTLSQAASDRNKIDRLNVMTDCGSSKVITAIASNLIMTNGPGHILDEKCVYVP